MSYKDLPSIDEFAEDLSNLPSIQDFITEENAEELPSVEDFIEKEEEILTEATQTIEDADGNQYNINEQLIKEGHAYVYEGGKKKIFRG